MMTKSISFGAILKDFFVLEPVIESEGWRQIILPYSVILSQACDVEQYITQYKVEPKLNVFLPNILILPLYEFEVFANGEHLKNSYSIIKEKLNTGEQKKYIDPTNSGTIHSRYHYIDNNFCDITQELKLIADFKHYYTVNMDLLEKQNDKVHCYLKDLYKEQLSQRFCNYLSRIGLPT